MQKKSFLERIKLYITRHIGTEKNHDVNKQKISNISGLLSVFFIVSNYFNFLKKEDKHN